jgi:hypothetical protein
MPGFPLWAYKKWFFALHLSLQNSYDSCFGVMRTRMPMGKYELKPVLSPYTSSKAIKPAIHVQRIRVV